MRAPSIPLAKRFVAATDLCEQAYDVETNTEAKYRLARAAFLFGQMAEYLERRNSMTSAITTRCNKAIGLIGDDALRRKIRLLISDETS